MLAYGQVHMINIFLIILLCVHYHKFFLHTNSIPFTVPSTSPTEPTTSFTTNTTQSSTSISVVESRSTSSWPDEASFPVAALLSAICIFLTVLTAALITCNIKLQRQLRDKTKNCNAQARHTAHTNMCSNNHHYDPFPKHLWQTAVPLDSSNDADLW